MSKLNWTTTKVGLAFLIVFFLALFATNAEPYVRSDGFCYYHIAKSIINEHSFVSANEPEYWDYMGHVKETYNNKYISVCAPGAALFTLPGLIVANVLDAGKNIENDYFVAYNGHTFNEGMSILVTTTIFAGIAMYLIYRTSRELGINKKISILSSFLIFFSSYTIWYVLIYPTFTHVYEIFSVSLLLYTFVRYLNTKNRNYLLGTGAALGIMVITRPVLIPIGIIVGLYLLYKKEFKGILKYILGGIPFAVIYMLYNFVSYGKLISSGYSDVRTETFNFLQFNGLNVLFSGLRGFFVYSPIFLFAVAGLILLYRRSKILAALSLTTLIIVASIYGFWPAWWGGGSYGSRFMIFFVPFGVLGLAFLISFLKDKKFKFKNAIYSLTIFGIIVSFLFSFTLTFLYRFTPLQTEFYTPVDLFKYQYDSLKSSGSVISYIKNLPKSIPDGSGLMALALGISDYAGRVYETPDSTFTIKFYKPPISRQPFPEKINFYVVDDNKNVYEYDLSDMPIEKEIKISCNNDFQDCTASEARLKFINKVEALAELPVSKYKGIQLKNKSIRLFFMNSQNIQFRGNLIPWKPADPNYRI